MAHHDARLMVLVCYTFLILFVIGTAVWLGIVVLDYQRESSTNDRVSSTVPATCFINNSSMTLVKRDSDGICLDFEFDVSYETGEANLSSTLRESCVGSWNRYVEMTEKYTPKSIHECWFKKGNPERVRWPYRDPQRLMRQIIAGSCMIPSFFILGILVEMCFRYGWKENS